MNNPEPPESPESPESLAVRAALSRETAPGGTTGAEVSASWAAIEALVADAKRSGWARNTIRAYRSDLADFAEFCRRHGRPMLPTDAYTVAGYAVWLAEPDDDRAGLRPSTIGRRLSAISTAHQMSGHPSPTLDPHVKATMKGIRRTHGTAPAKKRAVSTADLVQVLAGFDDSPRDVRDAAILLLGFAGARRRSELAALRVGDLEDRPEGLAWTIRSSKTDQEAIGHTIAIVYGDHELTCPVRAVRAWLELLGHHETLTASSPVWRPIRGHDTIGAQPLSTDGIAQVVKRRMTATGFVASEWGGHSLRRGHATEAARNGASDRSIMATGDWASVRSVDGYVAAGTMFDDPSSGHLDL